MNEAENKEFAGFIAYTVQEWSKTHIVLVSPIMRRIFGKEVLVMT